ncbi:MAG: hypothetical protein AB8G77_06515 [Rhodothermales bacterium]
MKFLSSVNLVHLLSSFNAKSSYVLTLAFVLLISGCIETVTGVTPTPEDTEPEPQFEKVYDLKLTTKFIWITGSCDKTLGTSTSGEFQYRYEINGGGKKFDHESLDFDSRFGVVYNKVADNQINFADKTYSWSGMSSPAEIDVKLFGTEWDGVVRDSRMNNRQGSRTVPYKLGTETRTITIGATAECQMYLAYSAHWAERMVPV